MTEQYAIHILRDIDAQNPFKERDQYEAEEQAYWEARDVMTEED